VSLREVLQMARMFGAFTAAQAAVHLGLPLDEAARRLDKAVEEGLLKAVDVAGVSYRDPVEAADVILGSVDLSVLPRAEREKLMRL
jgi:hypothetical protein